MNRLVTGFLYDTPPCNPEESIGPFMAVTPEQVQQVAHDLLDEKKMAITVVSPSDQAIEIIDNSPWSRRPATAKSLGGDARGAIRPIVQAATRPRKA